MSGNAPFTVAIDGPAAAGKGTIAKRIAGEFGFRHLDTGLLYRAVGLRALKEGRGVILGGSAIRAACNLTEDDVDEDALRTGPAAEAASKVAVIPEVRSALLDFQREFARRPGGAVLDGRDIGTVVCPDAEVKLYVTASDEVRARRRHAELFARGVDITEEEVLADLKIRDARDAARAAAPMKPAEDAVLLDTTELSIDAAVAEAAALIKKRRTG